MTRELEVDQVLRSWLSDGAEHAPERHLMAALERIEAMPQRQPLILPRLALPRGEAPSTPRLAIGLMVVILVAALGIGLGMQIGLIRLPGPQPAPSPGPDNRDARNVELFSNPGDGYELLLPMEWEEVSIPRLDGEPAAGVRRFRAPSLSYRALTISVGEPNGTVRICEPSCREVEGQVSLDVLQETLVSSPEAAGWRQVHGDAVIGGVAARFERPNTGGTIWNGEHPTFYHFFGLQDGRPVVLSFDYWPIRRGAISTGTMHEIVESLRYLNAESNEDAAGSAALYSYPDNGYEVMLPDDWEVTIPMFNGDPVPGVRRFGTGVHTVGAVLISIGDSGGTIWLCAPRCIEAVGLETLDDLKQALRTPELIGPPVDSPYGQVPRTTPQVVVRGATILGGELAGFVRPDSRGVSTGDDAYHHVYTFHDGRPVVLSVEYESIRLGRISDTTLNQILESFRFGG